MAAFVVLLVIDEFGINSLCPAPRGLKDLARKGAKGGRDGDVFRGKKAERVFPIDTSRGDRRVRQPVERDVVEDIVSRKTIGLTVEDACKKRVMAGLFHGSQIYGADDDLSRDHGWGPMFTLFLSEEDYTVSGEELARRVRADAPREWQGFRFHYPDENIEMTSLERFFRDEIGYDDPEAWQKMKDRTYNRDFALYRIRHGHVLYDPAGEFARWRAAFHAYPRFIWLARVEQELFQVWHYGQYNFLDRLAHRRDPVAIQIALGHFTEAVMRLCLLLEHDYGPYWKWLAFEFRKRASAQQLDPLLRALTETLDIEARSSLVHTICEEVH